MAKPELGTKRTCPVTGRKFYDLNKDPIVSPFTGETYPRSYFEPAARVVARSEEDSADEEPENPAAEVISLEEAEAEAASSAKSAKAGTVDDDVDIDEDIDSDDDDAFLEEDDDSNDDVSDLIVDGLEEDEEG